MSRCKWNGICFLGGVILIAAVSCESFFEDKQPPGVKECRVHIEKALEQYWNKKEPAEISNPTKDINANYLDKSNFNFAEQDSRAEETESSHLNKQDYTEEKEDEEHPNGEDNNKDKVEIENNEDQNDNVETKDNEEDNENTEAENDKEDTSYDNDEDTSYDNDEDTHEEEVIEYNVQNTESINNNADDDEEEAENDSENKYEENINEDGDNDNEDDDENDEKSGNIDEQDVDEIEHTIFSAPFKTSAYNDDVTDLHEDDKNDENKTNHKEESTENEESVDSDKMKEDEEALNETDDDEDDDDREESNNYDYEVDSTRNQSDIIPEEPSAEYGKASEEKTPPTEETDPAKDISEAEDVENIYEEEEPEEIGSFRSREHIDIILGSDAGFEKEEEKMAQSVFREIKKIETTHIKPVESLYKYADSTTRSLGDAEIFSKPMLLFLGPWGAGKTSIINYLLGLERTSSALKTGSSGLTNVDFTLLTYGTQRRIVSGTELAVDWKYAGIQKFGQGFLDHFRSIHIPHPLLQKVTLVDTPGVLENRNNANRGYSLNAAFQWFIDRADAVYVVLDPSKVDIGGELGSVIEQLQGQNVRFLLNKADSIRRSDLMRVVGQLFWNLSPLLGGSEAPIIYAVSLTSHPYHPSAPARFLADQEKNFLYDIKSTLEKQIENKILYARKHAVRVRNHAKMVDCYLASYYRHKSIFSNKRNIAKLITENPKEYSIYDGLTGMANVSRSDVPNPLTYKEFFKIHPLYDFKPLASTCSYFRGCPMDKVDLAITKEFPELLAKYKEAKRALYEQLEQER